MTERDTPPVLPTTIGASVPTEDETLLVAVVARGESAGQPGWAGGLMLLSAAAFVGLGGLHWGWHTILHLAVAIALHEIGHVLAMRIFGYKNVRMLFIPLFGGLATGEPRELDAARNALVALAGPVFGLFSVGVAGAVAFAFGSPLWLVEFAWLSLFLNALNLLPLVPLDGGQITNDLLFSRVPVLELVFRLLAVAGTTWLAITSESWFLALLPFVTLIATPFTFRRARILRDLRDDPAWQQRTLDVHTVGLLREAVARIFAPATRESYEKKLPEHVHSTWLEIRKRFPSTGRTVGLLAAYLFVCLVAVPALGAFLAFFLARPEFLES